ncbi:TMV resistance protein N-like protein isoform X1, partial [Tanacetum coccineum]
MQLDQASIEDILIPNMGYSSETLYEIDCVQRILDQFMLMERDQEQDGSEITESGFNEDEDDDDELIGNSRSLTPMTMVANLIDNYLAEVASDAHPWLTDSDRELLCRLTDCQKLSLEASTHAAQNERLPLRFIVQVLFFEQIRLRTSVAGCLYVSDNYNSQTHLSSSIALPESGNVHLLTTGESDRRVVAVDDMRGRVSELEKECLTMKKEIDKLVKTKGVSWNNLCKMFGLGLRLKSKSRGSCASSNDLGGKRVLSMIRIRAAPKGKIRDQENVDGAVIKVFGTASEFMDGALITSSSSSSSSATAATGRWTYNVFLSFHGEDTRNNFVDHLYAALDQAGIYTFKDDKKLQRGESIPLELVKAIQESMVAVVVFSRNYANSSWCLEELVNIMECQHLIGQKVLPVFYDVKPSDVRGQKRSFHSAFEQHGVSLKDNMEKVKIWREALVTAANLSGWDVHKTANGHEAECIKQIVRYILSYTESCPAENLIGMESRVEHVKELLSKRGDDVCMVGIWGMGGIGKTTIARAVYRQIWYQFEGSSFLEDVRENGSDKKGLKKLQEKLLSEILMDKDFKVKDCDDGICQIQRKLGRKKVLIVLDDVDNFKLLELLVGAYERFGPGSRIIITTRDEHLLSYAQEKYAPQLLMETEATRLFSRYAFKANLPPKAYKEVSAVVVSHTGHLPLALKVLGSHFCGRSLEFWKSAINVLARIPHKEINGILKVSFDGLNILEQKIFLLVACFFKGRIIREVTRILDSLCLEAKSGIKVLIEKSLLTISYDGTLDMHDLIEEMGRCIVLKCNPNNMVWVAEEIKEVMTTTTRLKTVEAIVDTEGMTSFSAEVLNSMKKLKLLEVRGYFTWSEPTCLPEQLRWISWTRYPFESLRITSMINLVGLEIAIGYIEQLQIDKKVILTNLKFINLLASSSITSFPDVSGLPNLERLELSGCEQLVDVHESVFLHERIILLDLTDCSNLDIHPPFNRMKSLLNLRLHNCKSIQRFPKISKETGRLSVLDMDGCEMMRRLPSSISLLTSLTVLTVKKYNLDLSSTFTEKQCIQGLTPLSCLRLLDLEGNNIEDDDFPRDLYNTWPSLEELGLSWNPMNSVPTCISQLSHLKYLNLSHCTNLKELRQLPSLIQILIADNCTSLEKIEDVSHKYKWLFQITLSFCPKLKKADTKSLLKKSFVQKCAAVKHIIVPRSNIPSWLSNQRLGNIIDL